MSEERKPRGDSRPADPALQLSKRQVIAATCALLVGACVLFLAGNVTHRIEVAYRDQRAANTEAFEPYRRQTDTQYAGPLHGSGSSGLRQTTPADPRETGIARPEQVREFGGQPYVTVPTPDAPPAGSQQRDATRVSSEGPKALSEEESGPDESTVGKRPGADTGPKPGETDSSPPSAQSEAPETGKTEAAASNTPPPLTPPPPPPEKEDEGQEVAPSEPAPQSGFGIQVRIFSKNEKSQATSYCSELRERLGSTVEIIDEADMLKIVVGRNPDRKAVETLRTQLTQQAEFKDCWIREVK